MITRCVHIDWLEVHCLEPSDLEPRDPDFFRRDGWQVNERDYGTRTYAQMFTLLEYDSSEPLIEVRRSPVGNKTTTGVYVVDPHSCHIRLHNRTCYFSNPAGLLFEFLMRYHYSIMRISRIDLCLDFERFDSGDDPQKFVQRYLANKYHKINVTDLAAHGKDLWDGRCWNSLKWGAKKSMISTKLYNKTLELKQGRDKPYIRQSWTTCGLVDDFIRMTKQKAVTDPETGEKRVVEYQPTIWRLEFSISSSVKRWFVIEDYRTDKKKLRSIHNTLDEYFTPQQQLDVFFSLVDHYFHFKKPALNANGEPQRKDRCPDKVLFRYNEQARFFKIDRVATARPAVRADESLRRKLQEYKMASEHKPDVVRACDIVLGDLQNKELLAACARPWDDTELTLLRSLVSYRTAHPSTSVQESLDLIRGLLLQFGEDSFGEHDGK